MTSKKDINQPQEYVDTFMIECSRLQATEKTDNDKSKWKNDCGNGIKVMPGDSIEVSSAFLNANGAGDGVSSISFDGKLLGSFTETGLWTDSTYNFTGTYKYNIYDNKTKLKINYYKNNDGLCCLRLPCTNFKNVWEDNPASVNNFDSTNSTNRYVPIQTSDNGTGKFTKANVLDEYKQVFDGQRFTIYKRDKAVLNLADYDYNEYGYYMWYEYQEFIDIETDKGFNNVNNVAQDITIELNKVVNEFTLNKRPRIQLTETNFRLENTDDQLPTNLFSDRYKNNSIIKETQCFKSFKCGTRYTLCDNAFTTYYNENILYNDVYKENFDFVATKYSNFRNAGLKIGNRWSSNQGPNIPTIDETIEFQITAQWVTVSHQFWDEREKYFEFFDTQQKEQGLLEKINYNANNERFIHISTSDGYTNRVGSDMKFLELSHIAKVHFNSTYYGIETEATVSAPWKGFLVKVGTDYYIKLTTPTSIKYPITAFNRSIGYDRAFSAYGNDSILLFNGMSTDQDPNTTVAVAPAPHPQNIIQHNNIDYYTDITIDRIYLGCFPKLQYNSVENKFEFSDLHTGRPAGNTPYSLTPIGVYSAATSLNPNAGNNYYYINPYNHPIIYHPHIRPVTTTPNDLAIDAFYNVPRWTIFDSFSGIGIKSFGIDSTNNYRNFLYVLGFKNLIPDLNVSKYSSLTRNNFNISSYPFTTNAQIESQDIIEYSGNLFGAAYFTPQPPVLQQIPSHSWNVGFNQIIVNATSTTFTADSIASKTNHGFYIIRSDMIGESKYISNGQLVNTVSIVSKENRIDDFLFMQSTGDMVYTFKQPCTIQNIKTEIYNNDNTPAILDENNSVIYKIRKKNIETIMID
jgi:hypothetical protein